LEFAARLSGLEFLFQVEEKNEMPWLFVISQAYLGESPISRILITATFAVLSEQKPLSLF
jgi:hypothetical protein